MKNILFVWLLWMVGTAVQAQSLKGRVVAADSHKPIIGANVFLSNTSVGTTTRENGEFVIPAFPAGRYDLVVSFVGYESYTISVQSNKLPAQLDVVLKPKVEELQEVIVEKYEKDGWQKWGQFFLDNFIGTSKAAAECKLLNKDVLRFRLDKKTNTLIVVAYDRLEIENKALGYRLKYDLTRFDFNFSTRVFIYQGYPLFEEMETKRSRQLRRWEQGREDAYYGSMMHFMRSLFRNKLIEQHFEVRRLIRIPESEKKRVRTVYQAKLRSKVGPGNSFIGTGYEGLPPDTVAYYKKVMQQPESMDVLVDRILPGDSIAYAIDSTTVGLEFNDWLQVIYTQKKMPEEYFKSINRPFGSISMVSELVRTDDKPIMVWANGSYYEGASLLSSQYWGWSEKIASLLPTDYWPQKKPDPKKK